MRITHNLHRHDSIGIINGNVFFWLSKEENNADFINNLLEKAYNLGFGFLERQWCHYTESNADALHIFGIVERTTIDKFLNSLGAESIDIHRDAEKSELQERQELIAMGY